jgi:hypothetical protein
MPAEAVAEDPATSVKYFAAMSADLASELGVRSRFLERAANRHHKPLSGNGLCPPEIRVSENRDLTPEAWRHVTCSIDLVQGAFDGLDGMSVP